MSNKTISFLCKGREVVLYENGTILSDNLEKVDVSKDDLMESLRLETNGEDLNKVEKVINHTRVITGLKIKLR